MLTQYPQSPCSLSPPTDFFPFTYPTAGLGSVSLHCHNFSLLAHWRAATVIHCTASVLLVLKFRKKKVRPLGKFILSCDFDILFLLLWRKDMESYVQSLFALTFVCVSVCVSVEFNSLWFGACSFMEFVLSAF